MKVRRLVGRFVAVGLVPVLLIGVAVRQMYLVYAHELTPWLGGGFGMFATVDRVDHRVVRAYAITPEGERPLLLPRMDDQHRLQMKARIVPHTLSRPGLEQTWQLQRLEMRARVMPTPTRLDALAGTLRDLPWNQPDRLPVGVLPLSDYAQPLDIRSVRVEVWRLRFTSELRLVEPHRLAARVAPRAPLNPNGTE